MQSFFSAIAHASRDHGQMLPFQLPVKFCQHRFSCQQTKHDHFDGYKGVQEIVVLISKKDLLRKFHWYMKKFLFDNCVYHSQCFTW